MGVDSVGGGQILLGGGYQCPRFYMSATNIASESQMCQNGWCFFLNIKTCLLYMGASKESKWGWSLYCWGVTHTWIGGQLSWEIPLITWSPTDHRMNCPSLSPVSTLWKWLKVYPIIFATVHLIDCVFHLKPTAIIIDWKWMKIGYIHKCGVAIAGIVRSFWGWHFQYGVEILGFSLTLQYILSLKWQYDKLLL